MGVKPNEYKKNQYLRDLETDKLAILYMIEETRLFGSRMQYHLMYVDNGRHVTVNWHKLSSRFKIDKAATILYGKRVQG